jgi:hypothetical protein
MTKATKIDANTWHYRGFTIRVNFKSPNGTGWVCSTQQGYKVTPSNDGDGEWKPSIRSACERIDYYYENFFTLSSAGKWIVVQAVRELKNQRAASRLAACEAGGCHDEHLCRHGIDN